MQLGIDLGNSFIKMATLNYRDQPELIKDVNAPLKWDVFTPVKAIIENQFAYLGQPVNALVTSNYQQKYCESFLHQLGNGEKIYKDQTDQEWSAIALLSLLLKKLKIDAESFGTEKIEGVVATFPSHFKDAQKKDLEKAFKWSGVPLIGLVEGYKAVLEGYGFNKSDKHLKKIIIYDLGKTHFQLNIIKCGEGVLEPLYTSPKIELGGKNLDEKIFDLIISQYEKATNSEYKTDLRQKLYLEKQAERIKARFSKPFLKYVKEICLINNIPLEVVINRLQYERLILPFFQETFDWIDKGLKHCNLKKEAVDHILISGGSGKISFLHTQLMEFFKSTSKNFIVCDDPRKIAAKGAAKLAVHSSLSPTTYSTKPKSPQCPPSTPIQIVFKSDDPINKIRKIYFEDEPFLPIGSKDIFSINIEDEKKVLFEVRKSKKKGDFLILLGIIKVMNAPKEISAIEIEVNQGVNGDFRYKVFNAQNQEPLEFDFLAKQDIKNSISDIVTKPPLVKKNIGVSKKVIQVKVNKKPNQTNNNKIIRVQVPPKKGVKVQVNKTNITSNIQPPKINVNGKSKTSFQTFEKKDLEKDLIAKMIINNIE